MICMVNLSVKSMSTLNLAMPLLILCLAGKPDIFTSTR
jgi:hypothetical protein